MAEAERAWVDAAIRDAWILGEDVPGVLFIMEQPVEVVAGSDRGARGILISLLALTPEPEFHMETEAGGDFFVVQSKLRASNA